MSIPFEDGFNHMIEGQIHSETDSTIKATTRIQGQFHSDRFNHTTDK